MNKRGIGRLCFVRQQIIISVWAMLMSYQVSPWMRIAYFSVLFLFASALLFGQSPQIAIVHVTVINPDTDGVQSDMTVMVESQRITKVAKTRSSKPSKRSIVIDGRGKFLIPGLWDMHVHASNSTFARSIFLPLLVANGVTGVRICLMTCRRFDNFGTRSAARI